MTNFTYVHGQVTNATNLTTTSFDQARKTKSFVHQESLNVRFDNGQLGKYVFVSTPAFSTKDRITVAFKHGRAVAFFNQSSGTRRILEEAYPIRHWFVWLSAVIALGAAAYHYPILGFWTFCGLLAASWVGMMILTSFIRAGVMQRLAKEAQEAYAKHHTTNARPTAQNGTPSGDHVTFCESCGTGVTQGLAAFCAQNAQRFDNQILCLDCQRSY